MNTLAKHIVRFILFVLIQGLIFGQLNFGFGIHPMIYPLFIILLPFNIRPILLMIVAFAMGISVDFFMNTFGLHASAAVLVAYLRPGVFKRFAPRDDYDILKEPIASEWGYSWFLKVATSLIVAHHLWFFLFEYLKISAWKTIILNTVLSSIVTLIIFILIQLLFFKKAKSV